MRAGASILTVDDSSSMRRMVRAALEADGHRVREAGNGCEALGALEAEPADLVITDLYMPVMDGLSLLLALRERAEYRSLPVLLLTTERAEEVKARVRASGATGWLVKPFQPEELRRAVACVLGAGGRS